MQGTTLSVADILGRPGEHRDFTLDASLPGARTTLARLSSDPLHAELRAESVVEGILVTGRVWAASILECSRCLGEFGSSLELEVCELFVPAGRQLAEGEDAYPVAGLELQLEPMLRDAVVLNLPLKPVCADGCRGLCAGCGRNLNDAACACVDDDVDPRWAPLATLRERLES